MAPKPDDTTPVRYKLENSTPNVEKDEASAIETNYSNKFVGVMRCVASFFRSHREKMARDGFVGVCVGVLLAIVAYCLTTSFQNQHFDRQEVLDNTRFARQLSLTDNKKPLSGLNFTEADLTSIDLSNVNLARAVLTGADLKWAVLNEGAYLGRADLTGADLTEANLTGAEFPRATLTEGVLVKAKLIRANLAGADLTGADLTGADLTGVRFEWRDKDDDDAETVSGICYDNSTVWPEGYEIGLDPSCDHDLDPGK